MMLRKLFLLCLIWPGLILTLSAQIKPSAMLLPIYFVDLDKSSLQEALNNYTQTELSTYFQLKSEKEMDVAREKAFDKLSSENCTDEACIKVMGELLDVEYSFSLEIINTGEGWDMTAVRTDYEGVAVRRNELCQNCNLSKARKKLAEMLTALRPGEMLIQRGKAGLLLESTPRAQVFLNGREQGKTPLDLSVAARVPLDVLLVAEGYNDFSEELILEPGEKRKKIAKLVRKRGRIMIASSPTGAKIFIDGKPEIDAQGKSKRTPIDLRLVYGKHQIKLEFSKYQNFTQTLNIIKPNHGQKKFTLKPKPGRLIVRVPKQHKNATILRDGQYLGSMDGSIVKNFEVAANISYAIRAEEGYFKSENINVRLEADGSSKIEFEDFNDSKPKVNVKSRSTDYSDFSDWKPSLGFVYNYAIATIKNTAGKEVSLSYPLYGPNLQLNFLEIEFLTGQGGISIKDSDSSEESTGYFYFSDGSKIHRVDSTSASIFRIMFAKPLPEKSRTNSWIWGIGFEWVTLTFRTQYDGNRKIIMRQPTFDGGYQWNWSKAYFNFKYGFSFNEQYSNFSFSDGFSMGVGYIW